MDIGKKIQEARLCAKLTQEQSAEALGVSRQTISNWENGKTYPDIVSVISLSDLYSVTLDELLKGDMKMIEYLEKSTDAVSARRRFSKLIIIAVYLVIWALSILFFWLGGGSDAMGYTLIILYLVMPVSTLILSAFIGQDEGWSNKKWLMILFFGFMLMLVPYATLSLANMATFEVFYLPSILDMLPGTIVSALGMAIGTLIKTMRAKRRKQAK